MCARLRRSICLSDFIVRQPREDECKHMTALCLNSKRSLGYNDAFMAMCVDELSVTPAKLSAHEFWVYDEGGTIFGLVCIAYKAPSEEAEIKSFFIDATRRGGGIGSKLWEKVLARCAELKIKKLHLDSEPLSTGFYEKLGFKIVGEAPSGSIPNRVLPLMELDLDRTS